MEMQSPLRGHQSPNSIAFSSAGPQPPSLPIGGVPEKMHFQAGVGAAVGGGTAGIGSAGGDPSSMQQKMQRQRQLAVERQRAAAARQRLGVGVVAQSNPLAMAAASQHKASNWSLLPDGIDSPHTSAAATPASEVGRGPHAGSRSTTLGTAGASAAMSGTAAPKAGGGAAADQGGRGGSKLSIGSRPSGAPTKVFDELADGLDIEELVDSLTRHDSDPAATPHGLGARDDEPLGAHVAPGAGTAGVGPGGSRARPRNPTGGAAMSVAPSQEAAGGPGAAPLGGAWGVDDRLVVQGPPPAVVQVAGFDDEGPGSGDAFASPGARQGGRRRPPPQQRHQEGSDTEERGEDDRKFRADDDWPQADPGRPAHPTPGQGWDLAADSPEPTAGGGKAGGGGRRWWKPWQNQSSAAAPAAETVEVTQISAFNMDADD